MFLVVAAICLFAGCVGLMTEFVWREPFLPGVLTPFILIGGASVLLVFALGHYLVSRWTNAQMNALLAGVTLAIALAGIGFYLASALAMEAYLTSPAHPAPNSAVPRIIYSGVCGVLALSMFVANSILTVQNRKSAV
jgi:hypothetical protein